MKSLPIESSFPSHLCDIEMLKKEVEKNGDLPSDLSVFEPLVASELKRWYGVWLAINNHGEEALTHLKDLEPFGVDQDGEIIFNSFIKLLQMQLLIEKDEDNEALVVAEELLRTIIKFPDRKNEDFLAILAAVLYALTMIHHRKGANDYAERELTKVQNLLEKLAKRNHDRFAAAHLTAIEASTQIFKSRMKQINTLAHYQVATSTYLDKMSRGVADAATRLVSSLQNQGDILSQMGNYRDAVKYYTKALRYQKKISNEMAQRELRISINLGAALLHLINRRDTGVQLLTSLLPLAERLNATQEIEEIKILLSNKPKLFDFMKIIKKLGIK